MIQPLLSRLKVLLALSNNDPEIIRNMKGAISADIAKRYCEPEIAEFLQVSSLLDPRFKSLVHLTHDDFDETDDSPLNLAEQALMKLAMAIHTKVCSKELKDIKMKDLSCDHVL